MPAFTAAATAIVSTLFYGTVGVTFAAGTIGSFVVSVVASGLAYATSRLLGLGQSSNNTFQDPGVKIQLPPATNNKVPIVYGSANTKGIITDARISNENKTMTYVLTLSEETQTGNFTVGDIYWNDSLLIFDTDSSESHIVRSSIDQGGQGTTSTNFDGLIRVRVYAGSVDSADQIFPTTGTPVNARTLLDEADTNYQLSGLVFAVVQLDYSSEKSVTGLANMTFQLTNSLSNPGLVLYDYLSSSRYGANIPTAQINSNSMISTATNSLFSISNQIPPNQFEPGGTTATNQVRYQINGVLSTGDTIRNNVERICINSASWLSFDYARGQWRVIPNWKLTSGELAATPVYDDDIIIGEVAITATNLEDLYNELEVEFASRVARDQNDYYRAEIAAEDRNDLEPDNKLSLRLDLCNNAIHAARIGLIELKQSRVDKVITFRADYTALQLEAGDVIRITNDVYEFVEKPFRITRLREVEEENGMITVEVTALEYAESVYADENLEDYAASEGSGIPVFGNPISLPTPGAPVISNVNATANTPNFTIETTLSTASSIINNVEWFFSTNSTTNFVYLTNERSTADSFAAGAVVTDIITNLINAGDYYFKCRANAGALYSDFSASSAILDWNPQPAGANNGTINTSTDATNIFVANATSGLYNFALTTGTNEHVPVYADTDLVYNVATNKIKIGAWEVSTNTSAIYGQFITTGTQNIITATDVAAVIFDESVYNDGITLTTSSHINLPVTGIYYVNLSAVFENSSNNARRALMWLRKNGADEPDTNTAITVPARHGNTNGTAVLTVGFVNEHTAGDYLELYWNAEDADISIKTISSSTTAPIYPRTPGVLLSVFRVVGAP